MGGGKKDWWSTLAESPLVRVLDACDDVDEGEAEGQGVWTVDDEGDAVADDALEAMPGANPPSRWHKPTRLSRC